MLQLRLELTPNTNKIPQIDKGITWSKPNTSSTSTLLLRWTFMWSLDLLEIATVSI